MRVVVVGAGPAGLATAGLLTTRGIEVTVLDRAETVGASWRARYDGLRLNTMRSLSHLPGYKMPARFGRWVSRDDYVSYLDSYVDRFRLNVSTGVDARRIDRHKSDRGWVLDTSAGELEASGVVVATGAFSTPVMPAWSGLDGFCGDLRHAADYRSPTGYTGRHVLVVGGGVSGLEIALLLANGGASHVDLSVRSCQNLFTRQRFGIPLTPLPITQRLPTALLNVAGAALHGLYGPSWPSPLPRPAYGLGTALRRNGQEPIVADGVVPALRDGRIHLKPGVRNVAGASVLLDDGSTLAPDAVIAATGYTSGLAKLVGHLEVLDDSGTPIVPDGGPLPDAPGLSFVGFAPSVTGRLPQIPAQARRAVAAVTSQ